MYAVRRFSLFSAQNAVFLAECAKRRFPQAIRETWFSSLSVQNALFLIQCAKRDFPHSVCKTRFSSLGAQNLILFIQCAKRRFPHWVRNTLFSLFKALKGFFFSQAAKSDFTQSKFFSLCGKKCSTRLRAFTVLTFGSKRQWNFSLRYFTIQSLYYFPRLLGISL